MVKATPTRVETPGPIAAARRPTASVTIEPTGRRRALQRSHLVKLFVNVAPVSPKFAHSRDVEIIVREALLGLLMAAHHPDQQMVRDVAIVSPATGDNGDLGVEGSLVWGGRPEDDGVERMRGILVRAGAKVTVREKRECSEEGCVTGTLIDWNRLADVPVGWYSSTICARHNYRTCGRCGSVFLLSSMNAVGQSPALKCEVCSYTMIGYGGSKVWSAELVTRGPGT